ncbi:MAG: hypothetical protein AVDCRST_MAG41-936, partial [uncultured Corynebacteriales bacterium]
GAGRDGGSPRGSRGPGSAQGIRHADQAAPGQPRLVAGAAGRGRRDAPHVHRPGRAGPARAQRPGPVAAGRRLHDPDRRPVHRRRGPPDPL